MIATTYILYENKKADYPGVVEGAFEGEAVGREVNACPMGCPGN